jgi:phenylacetate-CoA ligase
MNNTVETDPGVMTDSPRPSPPNFMAGVAARVPRWLAEVPLYQGRLRSPECREPRSDFYRCFRLLPIITKQEIRRGFPRNFLRAGVDLGNLLERELVELERTAGTTEEPTPLLLAQGWWAEQERAALQLNSFVASLLRGQARVRRVSIVSPSCNNDICYRGVPSRLERMIGDNLFVNLSRHPFLWTEATLARMAEEAVDWQPQFLDVDPVYGVLFALYCERQRLVFPSLKFVLSSYEFLSTVHRRLLQRVFRVPVLNLFGSTETGHLLMENQRGEMTPNLKTAFLEVIEPDAQGISQLVVTTLDNDYMPLIRYGIGDLVRAKGQPGQVSYELHGRTKDALRSVRGHRITVGQVDQCLAPSSGIVHYQLGQESLVQFTLYYVPDAGADINPALAGLRLRLADLLGTTDGLSMRAVDYLPCETSGKYRLCRPQA